MTKKVKTITKAEADELGKAIQEALEPFREKKGPQTGLIHKARSDNALVAATETIIRCCVHSANELDDSVANIPDVAEWYAQLVIGLDGKIWTGHNKTVTIDDDDGNEKTVVKPVTTSPREGLEYRQRIFNIALGRVLRDFEPRTPKLKHHADARRFLQLCKLLFPNVKTAATCANGLRCFIENVHQSCGTEGATFQQKALWLLSYRTGGTGKSYFLMRLKAVCEKLGIDIGLETFKGTEYVKPTIGLHTVTISEDTPKLDTDAAELLNGLIDRSVFHYNIKFGASGNAKSCTNMVLASNYESFESNVRRYNVVSYLTENIETAITDEERNRYFTLWGKDAEVEKVIEEMFLVAPFKAEHADWNPPSTIVDAYGFENSPRIAVPQRFAEILEDVQFAVKYIEGSAKDYPVDGNAYIYLKSVLDRLRPSKMVKVIIDVCNKQGRERETVKPALMTFLSELKSRGQLGYRGKKNLWEAQLNWYLFDNFVAGDESSELSETDPFADTAQQWDALMEAEANDATAKKEGE